MSDGLENSAASDQIDQEIQKILDQYGPIALTLIKAKVQKFSSSPNNAASNSQDDQALNAASNSQDNQALNAASNSQDNQVLNAASSSQENPASVKKRRKSTKTSRKKSCDENLQSSTLKSSEPHSSRNEQSVEVDVTHVTSKVLVTPEDVETNSSPHREDRSRFAKGGEKLPSASEESSKPRKSSHRRSSKEGCQSEDEDVPTHSPKQICAPSSKTRKASHRRSSKEACQSEEEDIPSDSQKQMSPSTSRKIPTQSPRKKKKQSDEVVSKFSPPAVVKDSSTNTFSESVNNSDWNVVDRDCFVKIEPMPQTAMMQPGAVSKAKVAKECRPMPKSVKEKILSKVKVTSRNKSPDHNFLPPLPFKKKTKSSTTTRHSKDQMLVAKPSNSISSDRCVNSTKSLSKVNLSSKATNTKGQNLVAKSSHTNSSKSCENLNTDQSEVSPSSKIPNPLFKTPNLPSKIPNPLYKSPKPSDEIDERFSDGFESYYKVKKNKIDPLRQIEEEDEILDFEAEQPGQDDAISLFAESVMFKNEAGWLDDEEGFQMRQKSSHITDDDCDSVASCGSSNKYLSDHSDVEEEVCENFETSAPSTSEYKDDSEALTVEKQFSVQHKEHALGVPVENYAKTTLLSDSEQPLEECGKKGVVCPPVKEVCAVENLKPSRKRHREDLNVNGNKSRDDIVTKEQSVGHRNNYPVESDETIHKHVILDNSEATNLKEKQECDKYHPNSQQLNSRALPVLSNESSTGKIDSVLAGTNPTRCSEDRISSSGINTCSSASDSTAKSKSFDTNPNCAPDPNLPNVRPKGQTPLERVEKQRDQVEDNGLLPLPPHIKPLLANPRHPLLPDPQNQTVMASCRPGERTHCPSEVSFFNTQNERIGLLPTPPPLKQPLLQNPRYPPFSAPQNQATMVSHNFLEMPRRQSEDFPFPKETSSSCDSMRFSPVSGSITPMPPMQTVHTKSYPSPSGAISPMVQSERTNLLSVDTQFEKNTFSLPVERGIQGSCDGHLMPPMQMNPSGVVDAASNTFMNNTNAINNCGTSQEVDHVMLSKRDIDLRTPVEFVDKFLLPYCLEYLTNGTCMVNKCLRFHYFPEIKLAEIHNKSYLQYIFKTLILNYDFWVEKKFPEDLRALGNHRNQTTLLNLSQYLWKRITTTGKNYSHLWKDIADALRACGLSPGLILYQVLSIIVNLKPSSADYDAIDKLLVVLYPDHIENQGVEWGDLGPLRSLDNYELPENVLKEVLKSLLMKPLITDADTSICDYLLTNLPRKWKPRKPVEVRILDLIKKLTQELVIAHPAKSNEMLKHFDLNLGNSVSVNCIPKSSFQSKSVTKSRQRFYLANKDSDYLSVGTTLNGQSLQTITGPNYQAEESAVTCGSISETQNINVSPKTIESATTCINNSREEEVSSSTEEIKTSAQPSDLIESSLGCKAESTSALEKISVKVLGLERSVFTVPEESAGQGTNTPNSISTSQQEVGAPLKESHLGRPAGKSVERSKPPKTRLKDEPISSLVVKNKMGVLSKVLLHWRDLDRVKSGSIQIYNEFKKSSAEERCYKYSTFCTAVKAQWCGHSTDCHSKSTVFRIGLLLLKDFQTDGLWEQADNILTTILATGITEIEVESFSSASIVLMKVQVDLHNGRLQQALDTFMACNLHSDRSKWTPDSIDDDDVRRDEVAGDLLEKCIQLDTFVLKAEKLFRCMMDAKESYRKFDVASKFYDEVLRSLMKAKKSRAAFDLLGWALDNYSFAPNESTRRALILQVPEFSEEEQIRLSPLIVWLMQQQPYSDAVPHNVQAGQNVVILLPSTWFNCEVRCLMRFLLNTHIANLPPSQEIPNIVVKIKKGSVPQEDAGQITQPFGLMNVDSSISAMQNRLHKVLTEEEFPLINNFTEFKNESITLDKALVQEYVHDRRNRGRTVENPQPRCLSSRGRGLLQARTCPNPMQGLERRDSLGQQNELASFEEQNGYPRQEFDVHRQPPQHFPQSFPQNQYPPNQYPPNQFPPNQFPQNQFLDSYGGRPSYPSRGNFRAQGTRNNRGYQNGRGSYSTRGRYNWGRGGPHNPY
ncbi:uncharacterized protein LOC113214007 isoform X2 [Frankliniella occidentalis]|uniref:Uncharacterized protein LOC113214007 isoform X2 n=1 Tax=Frankliniella occidentalis TaxID=133901 RepID=A0A6J1T816_FRAOC|nr:uncharacterized protein LOC113214007 isoform X2 [Frankliniella occidentalis]